MDIFFRVSTIIVAFLGIIGGILIFSTRLFSVIHLFKDNVKKIPDRSIIRNMWNIGIINILVAIFILVLVSIIFVFKQY